MADEAQTVEYQPSELDRLKSKLSEKATAALESISINACKRLVTVIEDRQIDLAMASIVDEFDPQSTVLDKGKFEALEELAGLLRGTIAMKRQQAEGESE